MAGRLVEVLGRYSNHPDQGERIHNLLSIVPERPETGVFRTRQVQHRLQADETEDLISLYRDGSSVRQLTMMFSIDRTTVMAHLERASVARRPDVAKLLGDDLQRAISLYQGGLSLANVGFQLNVDAETVRRALKREGVELRPRRGWRR